jgi:hypothetical protein
LCIQDLQVVGQAAGSPNQPAGAAAERPTALSTASIHSVDVIPPA